MLRRQAGRVARYHTYPTLQEQSVGEHTWQVLRIYVEIWGPPVPETLAHILYHDAPERVLGDMPFHGKRLRPELRDQYRIAEGTAASIMGIPWEEISEQETRRVKIADLLDMWEFGQDEQMLGSMHGKIIERDTGRMLLEILDRHPDSSVEKYMQRRQREWNIPVS